ncbi:hypothetical protein [Thermococcus sp. AM4]|uniref:hypothetical protein n=1 Tax=Thermococcus sp. (strain AM4) TaxID=246969 RepID=UPI00064E8996|nr:hypothetical protein [Thermococcus sp. AM4]
MRRLAQGTIEYLFMLALILIIVVWGLHYAKIIKGGEENLADSLSNAESQFNQRVLSEVSSNLGG